MRANKEKSESDPRIAFVYQEALRGLMLQQGIVESMNNRAGAVIFATAFVSSLFGSQTLPNGMAFWAWVAVILLFGIGVLIVFMLWPYHKYKFRFDPEELLNQYIDNDKSLTMSQLHRELALRIEADRKDNWRIIQRLRSALQLSLILLLFEILAWLLAIARI